MEEKNKKESKKAPPVGEKTKTRMKYIPLHKLRYFLFISFLSRFCLLPHLGKDLQFIFKYSLTQAAPLSSCGFKEDGQWVWLAVVRLSDSLMLFTSVFIVLRQ